MEISTIGGSTPVMPVTPAPAARVLVENEATERVIDIESREAPATASAPQAPSQSYGNYTPAPLSDFQGTKVDFFA